MRATTDCYELQTDEGRLKYGICRGRLQKDASVSCELPKTRSRVCYLTT